MKFHSIIFNKKKIKFESNLNIALLTLHYPTFYENIDKINTSKFKVLIRKFEQNEYHITYSMIFFLIFHISILGFTYEHKHMSWPLSLHFTVTQHKIPPPILVSGIGNLVTDSILKHDQYKTFLDFLI